MSLHSPVALPRLLNLLRRVLLQPGDRVLDLGCGEGDCGRAVHGRRPGRRGRSRRRPGGGRPAAFGGPAVTFTWGRRRSRGLRRVRRLRPRRVSGATPRLRRGQRRAAAAIHALREQLRPGGWLLIGEGFRTGPIPAPYRLLIGEPSSIDRTLVEVVCAAEDAGVICQHAMVASPTEWEAFEWAFWRRKQREAADHDRLSSETPPHLAQRLAEVGAGHHGLRGLAAPAARRALRAPTGLSPAGSAAAVWPRWRSRSSFFW